MSDIPAFPHDPEELALFFDAHGADRLPGLLGISTVKLEPGRCVLRLDVEQRHHASNGYLHAATVTALADTACGYGCVASLPEGATGFATLETKTNHLGTLLAGGLNAEARQLHGGRTTQVWDATVTAEETGKPVALFRCTQLVIYPR
ncbi:MAG: PaaI family thioesterase [Acidimicrobiia bacterium]